MGSAIGAGYEADLGVLFTTSVELQDTKQFLYDIASTAVGELAALAGMAGDDDAGHKFATSYEPAARGIVEAVGDGGVGVWSIAHRLLTMATNYLRADDAVADGILAKMTPAPQGPGARQAQCAPSNAAQALPTVTGASETSEIPIIGQFWPQGDPDKLRKAGDIWQQCGNLVDRAQVNAASHTAPISATCSGAAFDAFREYERTVYTAHPSGAGRPSASEPMLDQVAASCRSLASMCNNYASSIEWCRRALIALAVDAGICAVIGAVLTIETAGLSDLLAAGDEALIVGEAALTAEALVLATEEVIVLSAAEEAEAIVSAAAARLLVGAGVAATSFAVPAAIGADAAQAAPVASVPAAGVNVAGLQAATPWVPIPPIPPPVPPPYGLNTPAERATADAWAQGLPAAAAVKGTADDRAYQLRVAGAPERLITDATGAISEWADGFRPEDGAAVEAKHVRDPSCTFRTLDQLQEADDFQKTFLYSRDAAALDKYKAALANPANAHVRYVEIDTDNEASVAYWQYQAASVGLRSNVRYVP